MVTPVIIQAVFWIGAVAFVLFGLTTLAYALSEDSLMGALYGSVILVFGPLIVRIWCELIILFFRMNETLTDIKNKLDRA